MISHTPDTGRNYPPAEHEDISQLCHQGMTQGDLNQVNGRPPVQGMRGMGMTQPVRGNRRLNSSPGSSGLDYSFNLGR